MSTKADSPDASLSRLDEAGLRRALRFAVAVTLSTALVYAIDLSFGFLTSVLVASLLATPAPRPSPSVLGAIALSIAGAFAFGIAVSLVALGSPLVYYAAITLLLYWIFHAVAAGAPAFPALMLLLGVVLVPVLGLSSVEMGVVFAESFLKAAVLALLLVWLAYWILPDRAATAAVSGPTTNGLTADECHRYALHRVLALLPLLALVVSLQQTSQVAMLLYAAILIQAPGASGGRMAGTAMIGGSLVGGAAALAITLLTTIYFSYPLLLLLVLLVSFAMAAQIFASGPNAALLAKAPAAMLILMDKGNAMFGDATGDALISRVVALAAATLYVAAAFALIERIGALRAGAEAAGNPALA
jgi:hypothetical protein